MSQLDEILQRIAGLSAEDRAKLERDTLTATAGMYFVPNEGPQSIAYESNADQIGYGGEVGGGKTLLILGSALQKHKKSLIMRRMTKEVPFLVERAQELVGHKQGYNGQDKRWRLPGGRVIQFGGALNPGDERGYKGDRKDLIALDEATEFLESQVDFLIGWLGSTDPNQHCQCMTMPPHSVHPDVWTDITRMRTLNAEQSAGERRRRMVHPVVRAVA